MDWGTFSHVAWGVRACQDGLGRFFSRFACLTEVGGWGGLKLFGQCPLPSPYGNKGLPYALQFKELSKAL